MKKEAGKVEKVLKYSILCVLVFALIILGFGFVRNHFHFQNSNEPVVDEPASETEKPISSNKADWQLGAIIQEKDEMVRNILRLDEIDWKNRKDELSEFTNQYNSFAKKVVNQTINKGENYVVSPISLYYALGLLSNAAVGETQTQLTQLLGMNNETLNDKLYVYKSNFVSQWGGKNLTMGNSLWLNSDFNYQINENYKEVIETYYGSDIFLSSFKDPNTIPTMNKWVEENTLDMIHDLFNTDNVKPINSFVVCNALAYDDKWVMEFDPNKNTEEVFKNYDSSYVKTDLMHSVEDGYWEGENAKGIYKYLNSANLILIQPNENMDIYEYLKQMNPDTFSNFMSEVIYRDNETATTIDVHFTNLTIPKFKYDSTIEFNSMLKALGVTKIFEEDGNFSRMLSEGENRLYLEGILQKATIDLNEEGISAAAATMGGGLGGAGGGKTEIPVYHELRLDRPFIYALVKENIPIFVGVVCQKEGSSASASEYGISTSASVIGKALVRVSALNIRTAPSTSAKTSGTAIENKTYDVYETKNADGYTWYRIGDNEWIASEGSWVSYQPNGKG